MFYNEELQNHLETSSSVKVNSLVLAEWNLNNFDNISVVGNYRYRPTSTSASSPDFLYSRILDIFDPLDEGRYYTDATYADVVVDGGLEDDDTPIVFTNRKEKERLLYSLEDCFGRFRPRSGINKARFFPGKYSHHVNRSMAQRPRYYLAHKDDTFKYWSSFRQENGVERGIAKTQSGALYYIDDAAPFVVYKNSVPANRIVVKMQTNVGSVEFGGFSNSSGTFADPFFGNQNKTTPVRWKIQTLKDNRWSDAISFNEFSTRPDGSDIVGPDGYIELYYGLVVPEKYSTSFKLSGTQSASSLLPTTGLFGEAYLVKASESDLGEIYVWNGEDWDSDKFAPEYSWQLGDQSVSSSTLFLTDLTSPPSFVDSQNGNTTYREIEYIDGLRVVAEAMAVPDSTFDLIEMSPRLAVDFSDKVQTFNVKKSASDLGISGMPVGQLLASTGSMDVFDFDQAFNTKNASSIIKDYVDKNVQIKLYEKIIDVNQQDFYVPIKTMYADGFPETSAQSLQVTVTFRDLFFRFEDLTAPQILIQNASLSYAISTLLDSVGFSNYTFRRIGTEEPVIQYFFIGPDATVAEVLQDLAVSTQTSMFFDEYNNFVMMTKEYILPEEGQRDTDVTLYGTKDFEDSGIQKNRNTNTKLANISALSSQTNEIYNDGSINYVTRYIQKSYGTLREASLTDRDKLWAYKPVLLWEVAGEEQIRSKNEEVGTQSAYSLAAVPLNSDLSNLPPSVVNHALVNNTIDLGEGVYWLSRYNGYFYSNGEIIKYDAVEYNVSGTGNVWISSAQEYQNYFASIPFNGKIYTTGLVRIYSEPNYEVVEGVTRLKNGEVAKHGRAQFGTEIVSHPAGISSYWSSNSNAKAFEMDAGFLFEAEAAGYAEDDLPELTVGEPLPVFSELENQNIANRTTRNGVIKNFLTNSYLTETEVNSLLSTQTGTVQSSALVMNGPSFDTDQNPIDFIEYVHKDLDKSYRHFGTRMRIVGRIENNESRGQTPIGSSSYYIAQATQPNQENNIAGASGGIAVLLNPNTHNGYFFEIAALTERNLENYDTASPIHNVMFYKTAKGQNESGEEIIYPKKLWGGIAGIVVDDGKFTGQYRTAGQKTPTVYDLAVEYEDVAGLRRFYLYINNRIVAVVDDPDPLPTYNNMALFVRGSARCMFENIYAITNNYSKNTSSALQTPVNSVFGDNEISVNESFNKYAMSGLIQNTYLSGISPIEPPNHQMYFEEFGTIMREASYFNIRYDKAFPALYAQLSPTPNKIKGYVSSGFVAGSYGAEFLIFNSTDQTLNLDETSGNYLKIQGVTFTQQSQHELTVDEYYSKLSDFSDPQYDDNNTIISPQISKQNYLDIKNSRINNGRKAFALEAPYIQNESDANSLMGWLMSKLSKPRKAVGLKAFAMPTLQLGDLVKIDYNVDGTNQVSDLDSQFVVYSIDYVRDASGPKMSVFLSEVS